MNAPHLVIIFARSRLAGHLGAHQMTRAILAATLLSTTLLSEITLTTLPAWADLSPVCGAVLTRTNQAYGRVLTLEATDPLNPAWDRELNVMGLVRCADEFFEMAQACCVPLGPNPRRYKEPANVEAVEVEDVALAIGRDPLDLASFPLASTSRAVAADLAGQAHRERY
jgi:hypothetical protein